METKKDKSQKYILEKIIKVSHTNIEKIIKHLNDKTGTFMLVTDDQFGYHKFSNIYDIFVECFCCHFETDDQLLPEDFERSLFVYTDQYLMDIYPDPEDLEVHKIIHDRKKNNDQSVLLCERCHTKQARFHLKKFPAKKCLCTQCVAHYWKAMGVED